MSKEAPFDVWDGEELGLDDNDVEGSSSAEEVAMHVDPESEPHTDAGPHWSELTDDGPASDAPVSYFADEDPDLGAPVPMRRADDEREVNLDELLERQHYTFPDR
jgi:hypothetical protein